MFDVAVSSIGILLTGWLIGAAYVLSSLDTGSSGFFVQKRVGKNNVLFPMIKIRTMRSVPGISTTVTESNDPRVTRLGRFFRRTKVDELPQLFNVLVGHMSFVGPRPDVPGYADTLTGDDRIILSIRPGITGPATLRFRNEEELLAKQPDPECYNREVIYLEKVRLNRDYFQNYSFLRDIEYMVATVFGHWADA
jgi:lipopolysaccharide/colanic/teichoic acid biosynthesis glycosyltransferase